MPAKYSKRLSILTAVGSVFIVVAAAVSRGESSPQRAAPTASYEAYSAPQEVQNTTPALGARVREHFPTFVDGGRWSLRSFENQIGEVCAGENHPGGGQGLACRDPETMFADRPLVYFSGKQRLSPDTASWDNAWVWGWTSPDVARLELRLSNCTRLPLAINNERLFFHVIGKGLLLQGVTPAQIIAYNALGEQLAVEPTTSAREPRPNLDSC